MDVCSEYLVGDTWCRYNNDNIVGDWFRERSVNGLNEDENFGGVLLSL